MAVMDYSRLKPGMILTSLEIALIIINQPLGPGLMVQPYNPSYTGGMGRMITV
jgi:hypothetical protein